MFKRLASFPNSRVKNRAPTREAKTKTVDLNSLQEGIPFLIIGAREDRTRLTVANKTNHKLVYGYSDSDEEAPEDMGASLEAGVAIDTDSLQALWGRYDVLPVTGKIELDEGIG